MEKNLDGQSVVRVLDFPENFRSKWSMYIDNESGCLREIIDNATDESYACKTCNDIFINTDFLGWNIVADSGRGIPIFMSPDRPDQTQADVSISVAHAGSKFKGTGMTKTGTFGLGSSIVNALSEDYILLSIITEDNHNQSIKPVFDLWNASGPRSKKDLYYIVWYKKGYKYYEGAHKKSEIEKQIFGSKDILPSGYSSIILFKPDPEIFGNPKTEVPVENLRNFALIQEKFYKRKVNLHINGVTINSSGFNPFRYEILKSITPSDTSQNKSIGVYLTFEIDEDFGNKVCGGSVNGLKVDSGIHIQYMESCYEQALKTEYKIKHRTIYNGLKMFVLVLADEISYDSQTKVRLKSITKVKLTDFGDIVKEFQKIFRKDPEYWETHVGKLNFLAESMKSLSAAEKAQKIIDNASGSSVYRSKADMIPGFSDATAGAGDRWNCELFITEGLSPSGSLKAGRKGTQYHAIMPLRGKVKNVKDSTADQMMDNKELFTIFKVLGLGIDANNVTHGCKTPEEAFEKIKKHARYGKICIATDADEDGLAIQNGLLYAISKFARFLVDFGLVYISESPIYEQGGKYFYPSDPRQAGTQFPVSLNPNKYFRRFKGLKN